MIVDYLGLPRQLEVLLIIAAGIVILSFDSSLFYLKLNLEDVWNYRFPPELHKYVEIFLKYILSGVILARTFTTHIFLALYIVMLWPAIFEEQPNLLVPWLVVGSIRCMAVNLLTLLTGSCVCIFQKGQHPICLDFIISQIIEHGPAVYAWLTILSYYKDLQFFRNEEEKRNKTERELAMRRRKARCMDTSHFDGKVDDGRNLISESTLGGLIHSLQSDDSTPSCSRSLDSLLKIRSTKEAKEEIMYSDSVSEEEQSSSILDRAMKILSVETEDIMKAKTEKENQALRGDLCKLSYAVCQKCIPAKDKDIENTDERKVDPSEPTQDNAENQRCECKKQSSVENEIELSSISLEEDVTKTIGLKTVNVIKIVKEDNRVTTKIDFLEEIVKISKVRDINGQHGDIQKGSHFGCQVSTLSKSLLNQPAEEVTKKFRFSKQIIFQSTDVV